MHSPQELPLLGAFCFNAPRSPLLRGGGVGVVASEGTRFRRSLSNTNLSNLSNYFKTTSANDSNETNEIGQRRALPCVVPSSEEEGGRGGSERGMGQNVKQIPNFGP